jgi:hypothetical protein
VLPTSMAASSFWMGAFSYEYLRQPRGQHTRISCTHDGAETNDRNNVQIARRSKAQLCC